MTAKTWKALVAVRISQLEIGEDSEVITTMSRASNLRKRTSPPLGESFCGNATFQVSTELSVAELLTKSVADVALLLRASLQQHTPEVVAQGTRWLVKLQAAGGKARMVFDANALTFIVSSWSFPTGWEAADFGAVPCGWDHGALTPIATVVAPRPGGDGVHVYNSGPEADVAKFAALMAAAE